MLAAGNPLSAAFWSSAENVLHLIDDGDATVGDVRRWLEATGTEPNGIIGLHVWDDASERSQLAAEMHVRLVGHLEEKLVAGDTDPDLLVIGDPGAQRAYLEIQERWMTSALPDGRVPMDALLDEKDEEFLAEWDAADAESLTTLEGLLTRAGDRPLPAVDLSKATSRLRQLITGSGWPAELLIECGGIDPKNMPSDDAELWLTLAAGVASPVGTDDWTPGELDDAAELDEGLADDEELSETDSAIAAICAIDHFDWLAVTSVLATGGTGTPASAADLAGYVRDFDPDDLADDLDEEDEDEETDADEDDGEITAVDAEELDFDDYEDDEEFDELGMESLFLPVTSLWQVLGAIDEEDRLTPLGWWGLPEAMRRVWTPPED